jgi:hypothetical protein
MFPVNPRDFLSSNSFVYFTKERGVRSFRDTSQKMQYISQESFVNGWSNTIRLAPNVLKRVFGLALKAERQERAPLATSDVAKALLKGEDVSGVSSEWTNDQLASVVRFLQLVAVDVRVNGIETAEALTKRLSKIVGKYCPDQTVGEAGTNPWIDALAADEGQLSATVQATVPSPAVGKAVTVASTWRKLDSTAEDGQSSTVENRLKVTRVDYRTRGGRLEEFTVITEQQVA